MHLSKAVGNTTLEGSAAVQRDLGRLQNDLMETHEVQQGQMGSGILHLGQNEWIVLAKV